MRTLGALAIVSGTVPGVARSAIRPAADTWTIARALTVAGTALLAFLALGLSVQQATLASWDRAAFRQFYAGDWLAGSDAGARSGGALDAALPAARVVADLRFLVLAGLAVAVVAVRWRRFTEAAVLGSALIALVPLSRVLEDLFDRPSPYVTAADVGTFPSGHAAGSMGLVCCAWLLAGTRRRRIRVIALGGPFALAVAFAVVADGGHWPLDVIGGWLLAAGWLFGVAAAVPLLRMPGRRTSSPRPGAAAGAPHDHAPSSRCQPPRAHG